MRISISTMVRNCRNLECMIMARFYMPDLGRWGVVDPLSELQFAYSPYSLFL
nr:hypothetical protein [Chryseobacterium sp. IHB B 17019]